MLSVIRYIFLYSICFVLFVGSTAAQQSFKSFDDLVQQLAGLNREQAYDLLSLYQRENPHHANTYFRLGEICYEWMMEIDPLTHISDMQYMAHNTSVFYGLSQLYLDDRDVKRNREYYVQANPTGNLKDMEAAHVQAYIRKKIDEITQYTTSVNLIHRYFSRSISHYNRCVDLFRAINDENENLKGMYLTASETFLQNVDALSVAFDSTLHYFSLYKETLAHRPIKDYRQQYALKNIETFRLDGLTNANFLNNRIELWNYGLWVTQLREILNSEIKPLRNDIALIERSQNEQLALLKATTAYSDSCVTYVLPLIQQNKINQYDYQSMILALFRYKQATLEMLVKNFATINDPAGNRQPTERLGWYYHELTQYKLKTDSLYKTLLSTITPNNIRKYTDVIQANYNGSESVLRNYAGQQKEYIRKQYQLSLEHYKEAVLQDMNTFREFPSDAGYRGTQLPATIRPVGLDFSSTDKYIVKDVKTLENGDAFITGSTLAGNVRVAFAAYIKENTVAWNKNIDIGDKRLKDCGMIILPHENGCFVAVASKEETSETTVNTIVSFDKQGKETGRYTISATSIPRYLLYDDISEKLLAVFYGKGENVHASQAMEVYQITATGEQEWTQQIPVAGALFDIVRINDNLLFFANVPDHAGSCSIQAVFMTSEGKILKTIPYPSKQSVYGLKALKITSNTINVIGQTGTLPLPYDVYPRTGEPFYLLTDALGELSMVNSEQ
jgi:hypothetical protein